MKIACFGDSWTHGYGIDKFDTYPNKLQSYSNHTVENISRPGASNYEIFDFYTNTDKNYDILIFCWSGITRTQTNDGLLEFSGAPSEELNIKRKEYFSNITMQDLFDKWEHLMIQINEENVDKKVFHFSVFGETPTKHIDNFYSPSFLEYLANEQGVYFEYDIPFFEFDFLNNGNLNITEPFFKRHWHKDWKRACVERESIRPGKNFQICGHPTVRGNEIWSKYIWGIINGN